MVELIDLLKKIHPINALVIGDYMLDKYTTGKVERISPEAPVAILQVKDNHFMAGGAGNVVLNLLALKANVTTIGRIGEDEEGKNILNCLQKEKADTKYLLIQKNYPTIIKNRFISESQQILRVDFEKNIFLDKNLEKKLISDLPKIIKDIDVIAISDYKKGFLSKKLLSFIINIANSKKIPTIVDPKGDDFLKYQNAYLIKPNLKEAYLASKLNFENPIEKVAKILIKKTKTKNLLITKSEKGMTYFNNKLQKKNFSVKVKEIKDVTGAGDTVLAMLALCIANNFNIDDAIKLSNIAAGIAIEHLGCKKISIEEISERLLEMKKYF